MSSGLKDWAEGQALREANNQTFQKSLLSELDQANF